MQQWRVVRVTPVLPQCPQELPTMTNAAGAEMGPRRVGGGTKLLNRWGHPAS